MKLNELLSLPCLREAADLARSTERQMYLVGGTVRDIFLRRDIKDIDIAVSGDISQWIHRLGQKLKTRVVTMGKASFMTYRLPLSGTTMDVWELKRMTVEEDAWRRDFSINAVYYDILNDEWIDPTNGQDDLKRKLIRTLSLTTFEEDPVRLLRAIRFKVTLPGFALDRATFGALTENRHFLSRMPGERVTMELDAILESSFPYEGFLLLDETGLLAEVLPELSSLKGVIQNTYHPDDVFTHTLACLNMVGDVTERVKPLFPTVPTGEDRVVLMSSLLLHDIGKPACRTVDDEDEVHFYNHEKVSVAIMESLSRRLRWSRARTERVGRIIRNHLRPTQLLLAGCPERGVRRLIHRMGSDLPILILHYLADRFSRGQDETALHCSKEILELFNRHHDEIIEPKKLVSGEDVMNVLGMVPGPDIGKILDSIVRRQVEGDIATREEALEVLNTIREKYRDR